MVKKQEVKHLKETVGRLYALALQHDDFGTDEYHLCNNALITLDALEKLASSSEIISTKQSEVAVCDFTHHELLIQSGITICSKCGDTLL